MSALPHDNSASMLSVPTGLAADDCRSIPVDATLPLNSTILSEPTLPDSAPPTSDIPSGTPAVEIGDRAQLATETAPSPLDLCKDSGSGSGAESVEIASDSESGFWPVLANRNFLLLWAAQVLSQVADKVYLVLMIALIESHVQSADQSVSGWVSTIMIAFTIPAVLFGSVAGVMVDWWPNKQILILTNLLRGGLVLLLPLLFATLDHWSNGMGLPVDFWLLVGLTFAVSTLTQFFAPAEQATIPLLVSPGQLLSANSLYTFTMMAAVVGGFAAGEPILELMAQVVHRWGGSLDLGRELVVGGSYILAGCILFAMRLGERIPKREQSFRQIWVDIGAAWNYLGSERPIRTALIQLVTLFSILAALAVLMVRLAQLLPEIKTTQFGLLVAAGGVGMAIGLFFLGHWGDRFTRRRLSFIGSIGLTLSLLGLGFSTDSLVRSLLLLVSLGFAAAFVGVPMQTAIQEQTPEEMRGKVFGLQNNLINIALSLPLALATLAESWAGLEAVFLGLAGLAVTAGFINWYSSRTEKNLTV
jgi:MFS family permease